MTLEFVQIAFRFVQIAHIKDLRRSAQVHPSMLQASSKKNKTASVVGARQGRVAAGGFAEAKREYLADVAKFAKRQEESNKRKRRTLSQEIKIFERIEKDAKAELKRIQDGACDNKWVLERAEHRLANATLKCGSKRTVLEAAEEKGWSGIEGEWIEKQYAVFREFMPWWHGERRLPQARDFEGVALRNAVEYRKLHKGAYEFAR